MFAMPSLLSRRFVISMNLYSPEIGRIVTLKTVVLYQCVPELNMNENQSGFDQLHPVSVPEPTEKTTRIFNTYSETLQTGQKLNHNLVVGEKRRVCQFCKHSGRRFKCGETRKSAYKCTVCNVFLCKKECFRKYHEMIMCEVLPL